ncbi:MAG: hypothetical protein Q9227_006810 [Pyrenula ochraceoflavens]
MGDYGSQCQDSDDRQYIIREEPLNSASPVSVVCIGAGVSGLATAIRVQETLQNCDFAIYEKNDDLGGTWYYVGSVEIHGYLKAVAEKHNLFKYVRYQHKLISAEWDEEKGVWHLVFEVTSAARTGRKRRANAAQTAPAPKKAKLAPELQNGNSNTPAERESDEEPEQKTILKRDCNVLINACGLLNKWKWPAVPGLASFKGNLCHSAQWDKSANFKGKNIAIIGSGSSAIQLVPELQPGKKYQDT